MIKPLYSKILLVVVFLALTLTLLSVNAYVGTGEKPADSSTSLISNGRQTTVPLWAQAEAQEHEHHCVAHCRHHYEERLRECNEPGHEHHRRCEEWARERERECLENCYREHPK